MIIAHNQKFVFIPIQKTGSTSVRECLDLGYNCVEASPDNTSLIYNHTSACRLKLYFEESKTTGDPRWSWDWDKYYKFTFVRNPFARMVSQYNYFCKIGNGQQTVKDTKGDEFTYPTEYYNLCEQISNEKAFSDFIKNEKYRTYYDVPYTWFCLDEFNFIGKTENLQKDFDKVVNHIDSYFGAITEELILRHYNKSMSKHYSEYYDDESRKIVEEVYGEDIERFKYKFEGSCASVIVSEVSDTDTTNSIIDETDTPTDIVQGPEKNKTLDTKEYKTGYSLVTCSMNRTKYLLESIETWNEIEELNEIIVVDYSSDEPILESDLPKPKFGKKIILIRVNNENKWVLSHAYNLGASFAEYDKLLKIDSDIKLSKDFIAEHSMEPHKFYTGEGGELRTKNDIHFNGQLICNTADFFAVNGYNERIVTYGYDDTDLYIRLGTLNNMVRLNLNFTKMEHTESSSEVRVKNQDIVVNERFAISDLFKNQKIDQVVVAELIWVPFPNTGEDLRLFLETQINRISCEKNTWTSEDIPIQWDIHTKSDNIYICERI